MWKLINETSEGKPTRLYKNEQTGSEATTELIHTDKDGGKWWGFCDLFKLPYMRIAYAKQISDLYTIGVTSEDLTTWCTKEKALLKATKTDPEAYEKLYALVLEKETLIKNTVDPLQQHLSLCTVYVLSDSERVDSYSTDEAVKKMNIWKLDPDMIAFFLNWHTEHMHSYMESLSVISRIVSSGQKEGQKGLSITGVPLFQQ
jgi:hypothetical protein